MQNTLNSGGASAAEEKQARQMGFKSAAEMYAAKTARMRSGKRGNAPGEKGGTMGVAKEPEKKPAGKKKDGSFLGRMLSPITDAMGGSK